MSADGHIRELVERTPVVTFVKDEEGRYLYVNDAWTDLFGFTREHILGRRDDELFPASLAAAYLENDRRVLEGGEAIEIEERVVVGGAERTFLATKFPTSHQGQRAMGGIAVDITDRVTARAALVRSEARYRDLVEHSPLAYVVLDPTTGRYVEANANALRLFELSEEELFRVGPAEVSPPLQADGRVSVEIGVTLMHEALAGGTPVFDWLHSTSRGELVPCRIWLARVEIPSGYGVRASIIDLRETKHAKEALALARAERDAIEDALPQFLAVVDSSRREIVHANRAYERTFGFAPGPLAVLLPEEVARAALEEGRVRHEVTFQVASGHTLCLEVDVSAFTSGTGGGARLLVVVTDVTSARKQELAQRQSHRLESLGRLAGGIAHDFNNLLTVIVNSGEFLLPAVAASPTATEDLRGLLDAAQRARTLTSQLLNFAREQVGRPVPVLVDAALSEAEKLLRLLLGEDIQLTLELGAPEAAVLSQPGQLEQAVMNLALNAREALASLGAKAQGRVTISTRPSPTADKAVEVLVADDGIGMSDDILEKAFDPFFTTKTVGKGAGLGLSAVHGIVTGTGGQIRIDSAPGGGTLVTMTFPVASADVVTESPELPPVAAADATRSTAPGRGHVLLVEDELAVRKIVARALERAGFAVIAAGSPDEALERAPDLRGQLRAIVSDIVMPKMNGLELIERLRPVLGPVPVLFISGYSAEALDARGLSQKDIDLLPKPFTPRDLSARLERLLAREIN